MSTNPPEPIDPNRQGQYPPPQWNASQPEENPPHYPPTSQYPYPPSSYPPPPAEPDRPAPQPYPYPPPPPAQYAPPPAQYPPPAGSMATVPHHLPPPPGSYRQDIYGQPPPPQIYQAAAPRQRTAIACKYCRRRKIRCSGFESSQDGRCSNCIRFNQECMFTPVSSQTQAFVPAHTVYPHMRGGSGQARAGTQGVTLYGAHGQPLPPQHQLPPDATLPPPTGMYPHSYGRPLHMDDRAPPSPYGPPMHQDHRQVGGRRGSGSGFEYPDPTNLAPVTPAVSTPGYQTHTAPSPYYAPQDRRPSPQAGYSYDSRHSASPHNSPYPPLQHGQSAATPPPTSTPGGSAGSRGGLNVRDMLNPGDHNQDQGRSGDQSQGRSSTDSDMLNALSRRGFK